MANHTPIRAVTSALVAATQDKITFSGYGAGVEILNLDATATISVGLGVDVTVDADDFDLVPPGRSLILPLTANANLDVRLKSAGAPKYHVRLVDRLEIARA
jgi:hypothetical protein